MSPSSRRLWLLVVNGACGNPWMTRGEFQKKNRKKRGGGRGGVLLVSKICVSFLERMGILMSASRSSPISERGSEPGCS